MMGQQRHDGSAISQAEEHHLSEHDELQSIGIRRWKLQKVLYDAVVAADIPIYFGMKTRNVKINEVKDLTEICFTDGTSRFTKVLFGVDGSRSVVRQAMAAIDTEAAKSKLSYMGVTCIMGTASIPRLTRGIDFPSSATSKCHGCFFPTGEREQCFQFHFPVPFAKAKDNHDSWANLSDKVGSEERQKLVELLEEDGWNDKYIDPLRHADNTVRVGFCMLRPPLKNLSFGGRRRVVLLGDAAHPPSIYTGQGAQLGLEDAAVIATLLKRFCLADGETLNLADFGRCMKMYENIRVPRTTEVLKAAQRLGTMQQKRANCSKYDKVKEELIQRDIFFHEHLPDLFLGALHDYNDDLETMLQSETCMLPVLEEVS
jgi:2-polyprenyl-6-methoxyphenol hydroxylase-like FAD-dependent oxidoreductase